MHKCKICSNEIRGGVQCKKHKETICLEHCLDCKYLIRMFWKCTYCHEDDKTRLRREFHEKYFENGQNKNAMLESTALKERQIIK